jgi:hypothetical protein
MDRHGTTSKIVKHSDDMHDEESRLSRSLEYKQYARSTIQRTENKNLYVVNHNILLELRNNLNLKEKIYIQKCILKLSNNY